MNRGLDPQDGIATVATEEECQHDSIERSLDYKGSPEWTCANPTCRRVFYPQDASMWINAFTLIRPKEEFLAELGRDIVMQLQIPGQTTIRISAT